MLCDIAKTFVYQKIATEHPEHPANPEHSTTETSKYSKSNVINMNC